MTTDHIGPETGIARDPFYFPGDDQRLWPRLCGAHRADRRCCPLGEYRWDGVGGTFFFIDPKDDMFAIVMMQTPSQRGADSDWK